MSEMCEPNAEKVSEIRT